MSGEGGGEVLEEKTQQLKSLNPDSRTTPRRGAALSNTHTKKYWKGGKVLGGAGGDQLHTKRQKLATTQHGDPFFFEHHDCSTSTVHAQRAHFRTQGCPHHLIDVLMDGCTLRTTIHQRRPRVCASRRYERVSGGPPRWLLL